MGRGETNGGDSLDNILSARLNGSRQFAEISGAVAQLGARVTGSHEATGSNPVSSTIKLQIVISRRTPSDIN